jgi:hypothetical protein
MCAAAAAAALLVIILVLLLLLGLPMMERPCLLLGLLVLRPGPLALWVLCFNLRCQRHMEHGEGPVNQYLLRSVSQIQGTKGFELDMHCHGTCTC